MTETTNNIKYRQLFTATEPIDNKQIELIEKETIQEEKIDIESNIINDDLTNKPVIVNREINQQTDKYNIPFIRLFVSAYMLVFIAPFTVADLYYAYTDTSCVYEQAGKIRLNLFLYLAVDGYTSGISLVIMLCLICCIKIDKVNKLNENLLGCSICSFTLLTVLMYIFKISWTILGAIIFWNLIDSNKCDTNIYNYIFAKLIIRFVIMFIMYSYNIFDKKK